MDYDKALRSVRGAAQELSASSSASTARPDPPERGYALSRGDDAARLLRAPRDRARRLRRRHQARLPPARARAPSRRQRGARRRGAVPSGGGGVRGAVEARVAPALRPLRPRGLRSGYQPEHFDFGNLADIFSAFFGDDLFATAGRPTRSRGADLVAEVEVELVEAARGRPGRSPTALRSRARIAAATGGARDARAHVRDVRRRRSRPAGRAVAARGVRPLDRLPDLRRHRPDRRERVPRVLRRRARGGGARCASTCRPESTTASASDRGRGPRGRRRRPRRRRLRARPGAARSALRA